MAKKSPNKKKKVKKAKDRSADSFTQEDKKDMLAALQRKGEKYVMEIILKQF